MELFIICLAVAYMVQGKWRRDTATEAYRAGKEPRPGWLERAQDRHRQGGGRRSSKGTPKGKGATRLMLGTSWAAGCAKAQARADDNVRQYRQWLERTAPERDETFRQRNQVRLDRRARAAERFGQRWNPIGQRENTQQDGHVGATVPPEQPERTEQQQLAERERRDAERFRARGEQGYADELERSAARRDPADCSTAGQQPEATGDEPDETRQWVHDPDKGWAPINEPDGTRTAQQPDTSPTTTTGAATVYQQAVEQLTRQADQVAEYRSNLASFADDLAGKKWGTGVTGPVADMDSPLASLEGIYRDVATQMKTQGDTGSEAYDQAPDVPGPEAVMQ